MEERGRLSLDPCNSFPAAPRKNSSRRKRRKGAFREDRRHATVIQTNEHLLRCIVYMDLNMVRAGVVKHPSEWPFGGYVEIQSPRQRYSLIDHRLIMDLLGSTSLSSLRQLHGRWIEGAHANDEIVREALWTESVAVGEQDFVETVEFQLGVRMRGRRISGCAEGYQLEEAQAAYRDDFAVENGDLSHSNGHYWKLYPEMSDD